MDSVNSSFGNTCSLCLTDACQQERINDDQHMLETNMIYAEIQSENEITVNDRTITDHVRGTWHALGCTRLIIS